MNLTGFDHLVLCVRDVDKTRNFYAELLGMEPREERPGATGAIRSAYFRDPDGNLVEVSNPIARDRASSVPS